jgi:hypothetical protein
MAIWLRAILYMLLIGGGWLIMLKDWLSPGKSASWQRCMERPILPIDAEYGSSSLGYPTLLCSIAHKDKQQ